MTALAAEVVVELDPELDEGVDAGGRLLGERPHRTLTTEAAPGAERVLGVQHRLVVFGERGGDTALRLPGIRRGDGALGEEQDVGLFGGRQGGVEPGDSAAGDHDVRFSPQSR